MISYREGGQSLPRQAAVPVRGGIMNYSVWPKDLANQVCLEALKVILVEEGMLLGPVLMEASNIIRASYSRTPTVQKAAFVYNGQLRWPQPGQRVKVEVGVEWEPQAQEGSAKIRDKAKGEGEALLGWGLVEGGAPGIKRRFCFRLAADGISVALL